MTADPPEITKAEESTSWDMNYIAEAIRLQELELARYQATPEKTTSTRVNRWNKTKKALETNATDHDWNLTYSPEALRLQQMELQRYGALSSPSPNR